MSLIERIRAAHNADLAGFVPLFVEGTRLGWLRPDVRDRLAEMTETFVTAGEGGLALDPMHDTHDARSGAMAEVADALEAGGLMAPRRGELYAARACWGDPPAFDIDRAACPALGLRTWGVHLTAYRRDGDAPAFWIGRRSRAKPTYPGELDNTVAGGQPAGLSFRENLIKECWEEASLPETVAARARPAGMLSYTHWDPAIGLKPDQLMLYDLELDADTHPAPNDDEIAEFRLLPFAEVLALVRDTGEFKYNCALVLIDFFIRHGLIDPDGEPDYAALCAGLTAGGP